jgi:hypothetical protein
LAGQTNLNFYLKKKKNWNVVQSEEYKSHCVDCFLNVFFYFCLTLSWVEWGGGSSPAGPALTGPVSLGFFFFFLDAFKRLHEGKRRNGFGRESAVKRKENGPNGWKRRKKKWGAKRE